MMSAKPFVYFWESVQHGGKKAAKERADYVLEPINKYHRQATRIMEIGCGIGLVLANFPKRYVIYGLDIKKDYIQVCRKKLPKGKFFVSSMHNFKIPEKFDVIFSADDAINFLKDFDEWKSTFKTVSEHLNKDGLFIFDVFTPKMLRDTLRWREKIKKLTGTQATLFRKFTGGYLNDMGIVNGNTLTWEFRIFERLLEGLFRLNEYRFIEKIYPVAKMKSALSKHFDILEATLREEGRVILFVCRRK